MSVQRVSKEMVQIINLVVHNLILMRTLLSLIVLFAWFTVHAQEIDSLQIRIQEIENSLTYEEGAIELESGNATLTVPQGFKYLNREQSMYVLSDLWGNPPDSSILGLLVPSGMGVLQSNTWVFTISFDPMGFVKDEDAGDIDYDDLLEEQQGEMEEENKNRVEQGYAPIALIGWASPPFYDKDKKILHWAKELKFGEDSLNTLNYNMRVLGRKGVFMVNAVATMTEFPDVKANIDNVIASVSFKEGHRYSDYIPDVDEVATWTIGGLVAGKLLAKAGFFALILKFWKIIAIGVAGAGGAIWKWWTGRRKEDEDPIKPQPS